MAAQLGAAQLESGTWTEALELLFSVPNGEEASVVFNRSPLGMELSKGVVPLLVTRVGGEAARLGVHIGWQIKAIAGQSLDGRSFQDALDVMEQAVAELRPLLLVREAPLSLESVTHMSTELGPLPVVDVVPYLKRFGFVAVSPEAWDEHARPQISLGAIDGHTEKGIARTHTWYALVCKLSITMLSETWDWVVERRLAHLRAMLHDPVKRDLGKAYAQHFGKVHFARRTGPPGTTARLEEWLTILAKLINHGELSPVRVAAILRFLETPEINSEAKNGEEPNDTAGGSSASTAAGIAEVVMTGEPPLVMAPSQLCATKPPQPLADETFLDDDDDFDTDSDVEEEQDALEDDALDQQQQRHNSVSV